MKKIMQFAGPLILLALPLLSFAAIPSEVPPGQAVTLGEIIALIRRIAQILTTLGVIIGVIYIVIGGIEYMRAGGSDDKVKEARSKVLNGFIGVVIVIGVSVIIQTAAALVNRTAFQ